MISPKNERTCIVSESTDDLNAKLEKYILDVVEPLMKFNGLISIGVSGGSMVKLLCNIFSNLETLDWRRIRIFMVDERYVPMSDSDSNCGAYLANLPDTIGKSSLVHVPYDESVSRTASIYEAVLKTEVNPEMIGRIPRFDLLFLGMGPDGHTCSLFPGHKLLKHDAGAWVLHLDDSPKPPPRRITLSIPCINVAKNVAFIVTGGEKAEVLKAVLDLDSSFPSALVKPMNKKLTFFMDKDAASRL